MIHNEVSVLRSVKHPGVVKLYEIFQESDKLILVMEFVCGGDLYALVKKRRRIGEKNSAFMLKGVAEALHQMHIKNYVHRDLKLENIMLDQKDSFEVKLVDFGFAE